MFCVPVDSVMVFEEVDCYATTRRLEPFCSKEFIESFEFEFFELF
jgi:hypothetical protein